MLDYLISVSTEHPRCNAQYIPYNMYTVVLFLVLLCNYIIRTVAEFLWYVYHICKRHKARLRGRDTLELIVSILKNIGHVKTILQFTVQK